MSHSTDQHLRSSRLRRSLWTALAVCALVTVLLPVSAFGYGLPLRPLNVQLQDRTQSTVSQFDAEVLTTRGFVSLVLKHFVPAPATDEIRWTAHRDATVERLAVVWGLKQQALLAMNPSLDAESVVPAGTKVVVYRADSEAPTQSVGRPNRGRLRNGMPFPEGPFWRLRDVRQRHFGTGLAIETTVDALMSYGYTYPFGPSVRIGELSKRRGGYLRPHRSHRSGRDIDIGYIGQDDESTRNWVKVDRNTIDGEKTWVLIKALLASGDVQSMYIDRRLQPAIAKAAAEELSEEELAAIFEYPRRAGSHRAIIQHWPGHATHIHVRFRCESWNARCRSW